METHALHHCSLSRFVVMFTKSCLTSPTLSLNQSKSVEVNIKPNKQDTALLKSIGCLSKFLPIYSALVLPTYLQSGNESTMFYDIIGETKFRTDLFSHRCSWLKRTKDNSATKKLAKKEEVKRKSKASRDVFRWWRRQWCLGSVGQCTPWINLQWGILFIRVGEKRLKHGDKKTSKSKAKTNLPPVAARLKPFIERGIANGIFQDDSSVEACSRQRLLTQHWRKLFHLLVAWNPKSVKHSLLTLFSPTTKHSPSKRYTVTWRFGKFLTTPLGGTMVARSVQHLWPSRCWRWWWRDGFRIVLHVAMG